MKIIFITREGYNLPGARIRCYNFSRELSRYGIDTEILSFSDTLGAKDGGKEIIFSWVVTLHKKEYIENIEFALECFSSVRRKSGIILDNVRQTRRKHNCETQKTYFS